MDIYLHFPEAFDEDKSVLNSVKEIFGTSKKKPFDIYYSPENINSFKTYNEESKVYLTSEVQVLRQFISSGRTFKINPQHNEIVFVRWNLDKFECNLCDEILSELAKKIYENPDYRSILINFSNSVSTCRNKILVFRDAKHLEFPDCFVKIEFVTNGVEFLEWLKTNHITQFSLRDTLRFQKRSEIRVKGATVYQDLSTKYFWHLDTLHNYIEYEVYNENKDHIGTANENGEIDYSQAVKGRNI